MQKIVNLCGTQQGFLRIRDENGVISLDSCKIPTTARIFLIIHGRAVELSPSDIQTIQLDKIDGAIIVTGKQQGVPPRIIMQGLTRGACVDLEFVKRRLRIELNSEIVPDGANYFQGNNTTTHNRSNRIENNHSPVLEDILNQAAELFSDNNTPKEKNALPKNHCNASSRNPFYATYPNSTWKTVRTRQGMYFLTGTAYVAGERLAIQAVPENAAINTSLLERQGFTKIAVDCKGNHYRMRIRRYTDKKRT